MDYFKDIDDLTEKPQKYLRAPFKYSGSKFSNLKIILENLPYNKSYIEVFGGSGVVLLNRRLSETECFNDRYSGVVAFYRCIRNDLKLKQLLDRLHLTIPSREEWQWCKDTWECDWLDDVERAARWYYMMQLSFSGIGRTFGRETKTRNQYTRIRNSLALFPYVHERFKNVMVDNQDWRDCIHDYDRPEAVFYLDPPYIDSHQGSYSCNMSIEDHREMLNTIFNSKGFFALSGYPNEIYNGYPWSNIIEYYDLNRLSPPNLDTNNKGDHDDSITKKVTIKECLWIKNPT